MYSNDRSSVWFCKVNSVIVEYTLRLQKVLNTPRIVGAHLIKATLPGASAE